MLQIDDYLETDQGHRFRIIRPLCVHSQRNEQRNFLVYLMVEDAPTESTIQGQPVVVKMPNLAANNSAAIMESFDREHEVLTSLQPCDNIVSYRTHGRFVCANTTPYLAIEYIEGETLKDLKQLKALPLNLYQVLAIVKQIVDGLAFLHGQGIYHCDLKPSNIMLDYRNERVVLIDFGSAYTSMLQHLETPGVSFLYAAPEQIRNDPGNPHDPSTDLHALAAMIYELLTNELCFSPHRSEKAILYERAESLPEPKRMRDKLRMYVGACCDDLTTLLIGCLHPDQRQRLYRRADDLLADLCMITSTYEPNRGGSSV